MRIVSENHFFNNIKGLSVNSLNHLMLKNIDLVSLSALSERPIYVFNELAIRENLRVYSDLLKSFYPKLSSVFYASKAFLNLAMSCLLSQEGVGIDVCSEGELFIALEGGISPDKIIMHGNNKSEKELRAAVTANIGRIIVDNRYELFLLEKICSELKIKCNILLRINPCIDVDIHKYNATGVKESKFGFYKDLDKIPDYLKQACASGYILFKGIHFHIGSNIHDILPYKKAIDVVLDYISFLKSHNIIVDDFNIGGGLGIPYQQKDASLETSFFVKKICEKITEGCQQKNIDLPNLMLEPGRSIVGQAGLTLYKIGAIKEGHDGVLYAAINGGMTDNIRASLYQAEYTAVIANKMNWRGDTYTYKIVGKCCESGDVLIENVELPLCEPGDVLVVFSTGAYVHSLANNYNKHTIPGIIFVRDNRYDWVTKEQQVEDLTRYDLLPQHLGANSCMKHISQA